MLRGIFPPTPTPFVDGEVAYDRLIQNLKLWNQTGLAGYLILGSNGEFVYLEEEEKIKVLQTVRENIPRAMKMIAGTGCESTRETIKLTRKAAQVGADYALVVTPSYFKAKMGEAELFAHYSAVAEASPIPILLYSVPQFTGVILPPVVVARLAEHPNIAGMKDSSGNIATFSDYLRLTPESFDILVGTATVFYSAIGLGAKGGILALANVAPKECVQLYNLLTLGKWREARELQFQLLPVDRALTAQYGIGGLKAALNILGYYGGPPRLPLLPPSPEDVKKIEAILEQAGLQETRG
jgi:4-hydroxy-2-oxoglutarate aldolase